MCVALGPVEKVPSPKSQLYELPPEPLKEKSADGLKQS